MLAAWFRLKYPHIATGALASSAPILQFDDITPWSSFYDAVSQDYKVSELSGKKKAGTAPANQYLHMYSVFTLVFIWSDIVQDESINCYEVIKGSWDELMAVSEQKEGLHDLSKTFRTCK